MTLQELLKKHGIEDEAKINEFMEDMKTNKIYTSNEENLDVRYGKLKDDFDAKSKEHAEASKLIEELKKSSGDVEGLKKTIADYETNIVPALKKEAENAKIEGALKTALANAKVTDVDYITFKIKEKGELKLDDKGNLKGIDDTLKDIKTAYPTFFETEKKKEIDVKELGAGKQSEPTPTNLTEALTQKYAQNKTDI